MKKWMLAVAISVFACNGVLQAEEISPNSSKSEQARNLLAQMRGISMQPAATAPDDGKIDEKELRRQSIVDGFRRLGPGGLPVLVGALSDHHVQMRRNVTQVLLALAGPWEGRPTLAIKSALPGLITALEDEDDDVRAWAAQGIGLIGADAKAAVPDLAKLLENSDEGSRNSACIALGDIGPAAKDSLPALHKALGDPSNDVRGFAQIAITKIEGR